MTGCLRAYTNGCYIFIFIRPKRQHNKRSNVHTSKQKVAHTLCVKVAVPVAAELSPTWAFLPHITWCSTSMVLR